MVDKANGADNSAVPKKSSARCADPATTLRCRGRSCVQHGQYTLCHRDTSVTHAHVTHRQSRSAGGWENPRLSIGFAILSLAHQQDGQHPTYWPAPSADALRLGGIGIGVAVLARPLIVPKGEAAYRGDEFSCGPGGRPLRNVVLSERAKVRREGRRGGSVAIIASAIASGDVSAGKKPISFRPAGGCAVAAASCTSVALCLLLRVWRPCGFKTYLPLPGCRRCGFQAR